ncbi:hypothetical protein KDW61_09775 [Burkholderia cenocepacia]|uniref:hypothetical protein n=1 Tax=Burkholderia TaxID=32008 RepID=UPI001589F2B3|nr:MULTISPECIES: hypothetical protein [Burkholderia]MBR8208946.1 hypothetical protein [Burkholderia cenocepacia]
MQDSSAADADETGRSSHADPGRRFGTSLDRDRPRRAINCPHAGYFFNPENEKRLEPWRHSC